MFLSNELILRDSPLQIFVDSQMLVQSLQETCPSEHSDKTTERHFFYKPLEILYIVASKLQGMQGAMESVRQWYCSEYRTRTSDNDCPALPRPREIFEQVDMGQPYSANQLRPVHPPLPQSARQQPWSLLRDADRPDTDMRHDNSLRSNPVYQDRIAEEETKPRWLIIRQLRSRELSYYLIFLLTASKR